MWKQTGSFIQIMQGYEEPNGLTPLRSILSAIGTCSNNLAKIFVPIIKDFTVNEYTVKDSL